MKEIDILASSATGTNDYVPIASMWDQVKGSWSLVLKLNLKYVSTNNAYNLHSKCLIYNYANYTDTIFFMLNTFCRGIHLLQHEFMGLRSFRKFLEFVLENTCLFWNLPSSNYFCIMILEFLYISRTSLCGLINQGRWLAEPTIVISAHVNFFVLLKKNYHANYHDMVSSV